VTLLELLNVGVMVLIGLVPVVVKLVIVIGDLVDVPDQHCTTAVFGDVIFSVLISIARLVIGPAAVAVTFAAPTPTPPAEGGNVYPPN